MKAICIGQAAYDITLPIDHFPIENKKMRSNSKIECVGGSACNCACLLAKWGINTSFIGSIGNDYYGEKIKETLVKNSIDISNLNILDNVSTPASYIISNTTDGTRTIIANRDISLKMDDLKISDKFDLIVLDGYEEKIANQIMDNNKDAIKILDAGSVKESTVNLAKKVDYVICSKDFAEDYSKRKIDYTDLTSLVVIHKILTRDFKNKIIITLEEKGCFTYMDGYKLFPTIKVKAIDSTGAGDIFHGAFAYSILKKYDLIQALKIANIAGAISTLKLGGSLSIPSFLDVEKAYNGHNTKRLST